MIYNVLANGFPLPFQATLENGVLTYDLKDALNDVEFELKDKITIAAGYHLLVDQKVFLINLSKKGSSMKSEEFNPEDVLAGKGGWTEWIHPCVSTYRMACCDCRLVHDMQFSLDGKNQLIFRVKRNTKLTKDWRKRKRPNP